MAIVNYVTENLSSLKSLDLSGSKELTAGEDQVDPKIINKTNGVNLINAERRKLNLQQHKTCMHTTQELLLKVGEGKTMKFIKCRKAWFQIRETLQLSQP